MFQPTAGAAFSAASVFFNLPEYEVLEVVPDQDHGRRVVISTPVAEAACQGCGVLTSRVHQRTRQRVADVGFDGRVEVVWVKKRWACVEQLCARRSFTEHTDPVPPRARLTQRLKDAILDAVSGEVRAVDRVAEKFGVSWPTVQRLIAQTAAVLAQRRRCRPRMVRFWGIDEHRFRSVRWFKDDGGSWRRTPGRGRRDRPVGLVPLRRSALVAQGPRQCRSLPPGQARQRHAHHGAPPGLVGSPRPAWPQGRPRMGTPAAAPARLHPLDARAGQAQLHPAHRRPHRRDRRRLGHPGTTQADPDVAHRRGRTGAEEDVRPLRRHRPHARSNQVEEDHRRLVDEIEPFIDTRVTNARIEAANVTIKNIKRTGRGYRSPANYRSRIMLYNAARSAA